VSVETLVELGALGLAMWAGWKSLPRPVERDGERLLKVVLATVVRGEVEAEGGPEAEQLEAWSTACLPVLLFHPAGRSPEAKLMAPSLDDIEAPALDGERGLVEALAALETPAARLRRMYVDDPRAVEALLSDPAMHGPAYDLSTHLAPEMSWDDVAAWSESLQGVLERRLGHLVAVPVGEGAPTLGPDFAGVGAEPVSVSAGPDPVVEDWRPAEAEEVLAEALLAACSEPSQRLVLLVRGTAAGPVLRAIAAGGRLRDLLSAAVFVDPRYSEAERAWLERYFDDATFEPEVVRRIPYATLLRCDPEDPPAWSEWAQQRLPVPPAPDTGREVLEVVDFGPVVLDRLSARQLGRSLQVWLALTL